MASKEIPQHILDQARELEAHSWYPEGVLYDGSPYSCDSKGAAFLVQYLSEVGDEEPHVALQEKIRSRKVDGETRADETCANWWLWTIFNDVGVSRVKK